MLFLRRAMKAFSPQRARGSLREPDLPLQRLYAWKSTGASVPSFSVCLGNSCSSLRSKYVTAALDSEFLLFPCDEKQKMNP